MPRRAALVAASMFISACTDSTSTNSQRAGLPAALQIVGGDQQSGIVGAELPNPLVARVVDSASRPVKGQIVNFRVSAGGGTVFAGSAITNDSGTVRERWTLGISSSDTQRVEARAVDNNTGAPLVFGVFKATALPGAATQLLKVSGDSQTAFADSTLAESLATRVADRYGNGVGGYSVSWTADPRSGGVSLPLVSSNSQGIAKARWTLGPPYNGLPDTQTLTATADTFAPVRFTATAVPIVLQTRIHAINGMHNSVTEYTLIIGADYLQTGLALQGGLDPDTAQTGNRGHLCLGSAQAHRQRTFALLGVIPGSTADQLLQRLSTGTPARDAWADSMARGLLTVDQFKARLGSDLLASTGVFDPVPAGFSSPDTVRWTWTASGASTVILTPADTACHN
jgi:hypothetical protein